MITKNKGVQIALLLEIQILRTPNLRIFINTRHIFGVTFQSHLMKWNTQKWFRMEVNNQVTIWGYSWIKNLDTQIHRLPGFQLPPVIFCNNPHLMYKQSLRIVSRESQNFTVLIKIKVFYRLIMVSKPIYLLIFIWIWIIIDNFLFPSSSFRPQLMINWQQQEPMIR